MTHALVLSLGHNSSAIAVINGQIICGYEEERFTLKKSDSSFPLQSIMECVKRANLPKNTDVFISHWFLNGEIPPSSKYYDIDVIRGLFPDGSIYSTGKEFTHHDAHHLSAMVFADHEGGLADDYISFVMDGFGTFGECISVYRVSKGESKITNRWFGFEKSLGMLYQYATAYMGMKMHNHEYKILAYETHIFDSKELSLLEPMIHHKALKYASQWFNGLVNDFLEPSFDPNISLDALPRIQLDICKTLDDLLVDLGYGEVGIHIKRVIVSRFVQTVVQECVKLLVDSYKATNVLVSGGLFYNVKINSMIAKMIPGRFCAMPLAGDQGAGLGMYQHIVGDLYWPGHLNWGARDLHIENPENGIIIVNSMDEAIHQIDNELEHRGYVNLVRGAMEFGPRALCNTSTLAVPDVRITAKINQMNDRTAEMPMAPVMTYGMADEYFEDIDKVHISLNYMIVTRDYRPGKAENVLGAAHFYKDQNVYTGRPQITSDSHMTQLLQKFGPLVNTSFNYHGVPIVFDDKSITHTHHAQLEKASEQFLTIVVKD